MNFAVALPCCQSLPVMYVGQSLSTIQMVINTRPSFLGLQAAMLDLDSACPEGVHS